jgi:hypothetical protein
MVGLMKDGVRLDVTPRDDGERITLDVDAVWAEAVRPIPRFVASLRHRTGPVKIELPEMRLIEVKRPVALPAEGGYVLAGGGRAWDGESLRLVVIDVRAEKR